MTYNIVKCNLRYITNGKCKAVYFTLENKMVCIPTRLILEKRENGMIQGFGDTTNHNRSEANTAK